MDPIGRYWRAGLVLFLNYGMDTGTVRKTLPRHEPHLWRHLCWESVAPDGHGKERSRYGWLFYLRVKTQKSNRRPMNRYVRIHLRTFIQWKSLRMPLCSAAAACVPTCVFKNSAGWRTFVRKSTSRLVTKRNGRGRIFESLARCTATTTCQNHQSRLSVTWSKVLPFATTLAVTRRRQRRVGF